MYIRTKDGVYEVDENSKGNECFLWVKTNEANIVQCVWLNCIIKQSENLEELCDEFVVNFECFNRSYYFIYKNSYDELKSDVQTFNYSAYGAIWTSKGLIYVAKMNDKGDLELI